MKGSLDHILRTTALRIQFNKNIKNIVDAHLHILSLPSRDLVSPSHLISNQILQDSMSF